MTPLDVLADMLAHVLDLIRQQPCKCEVNQGGLNVCRRCLLLPRKP